MGGEVLLEVKNVGCSKAKGQPIFSNVNFDVRDGDIIILQGKSGAGKTTLLKCLAHLNIYEGEIIYRGKTPQSCGIPSFRTKVLYVPQRPSLLPGTPRDFLSTISKFHARNPDAKFRQDQNAEAPDLNHPIEVGKEWGIEEELWDRNWPNLSGGESQRIALATAVGLRTAEILLLDEPTSALDAASAETVEKYLQEEIRREGAGLRAVVWITHSEEQGQRVGTRFLRITEGGCEEERVNHRV